MLSYLFQPHFIGEKLVEDFGRVWVSSAPPPLLHHLCGHLKHLVFMMLEFVIELSQSAALGADREVLKEYESLCQGYPKEPIALSYPVHHSLLTRRYCLKCGWIIGLTVEGNHRPCTISVACAAPHTVLK